MKEFTNIAEDSLNRNVFVDSVIDSSGCYGASISIENEDKYLNHYFVVDDLDKVNDLIKSISENSKNLICYDLSRICDIGDCYELFNIELSLLYDMNNSQITIANKFLDSSITTKLKECHDKIDSHVKACTLSKIDTSRYSLLRLMPKKYLLNFYRLKNEISKYIFDITKINDFHNEHLILHKSLIKIEKAKIKFDKHKIEKYKVSSNNEQNFINEINKNIVNEFVETKFNTCGTITGRITTRHKCFNCLSIPKKLRNFVISRFENGKIYSFDYNAIDYRCIISSVNDKKLKKCYEGFDDFHVRTAQLILNKNFINPHERKVIKELSYVTLYGGSIRTCSMKTGLDKKEINEIMKKFNILFEEILNWKNSFSKNSRMNGGFDVGNLFVEVNDDDHDGAILGKYAQSLTALLFRNSIIDVTNFLKEKESKIIIPLYDELIIDMYEKDEKYIKDIKSLMENVGTKFEIPLSIRMKVGNNFYDMKEIER